MNKKDLTIMENMDIIDPDDLENYNAEEVKMAFP